MLNNKNLQNYLPTNVNVSHKVIHEINEKVNVTGVCWHGAVRSRAVLHLKSIHSHTTSPVPYSHYFRDYSSQREPIRAPIHCSDKELNGIAWQRTHNQTAWTMNAVYSWLQVLWVAAAPGRTSVNRDAIFYRAIPRSHFCETTTLAATQRGAMAGRPDYRWTELLGIQSTLHAARNRKKTGKKP